MQRCRNRHNNVLANKPPHLLCKSTLWCCLPRQCECPEDRLHVSERPDVEAKGVLRRAWDLCIDLG